jgi:biopolymer transport protein ExbB/TolQ
MTEFITRNLVPIISVLVVVIINMVTATKYIVSSRVKGEQLEKSNRDLKASIDDTRDWLRNLTDGNKEILSSIAAIEKNVLKEFKDIHQQWRQQEINRASVEKENAAALATQEERIHSLEKLCEVRHGN